MCHEGPFHTVTFQNMGAISDGICLLFLTSILLTNRFFSIYKVFEKSLIPCMFGPDAKNNAII